jgi:competence protein ComEC
VTGIALALAFLAGAAIGWPASVGIAAAGLALLASSRHRRRLLVSALVVVAAGVGGAARREPPPTPIVPAWVDEARAVRGRVASAPTTSGRFQRAILAVEGVLIGQTWADVSAPLCLTAPAYPEIGWGDSLHLGGEVEAARDLPLATRAFLAGQGCGATMFAQWSRVESSGSGWRRWPSSTGRSLEDVLQRTAPGDAGSLLSGLVTGDDAALSPPRRAAFVVTGTSHLTAVSGANVALLLAIGASAGNAAGWRLRLPWQLAVVGTIWVYALVTGLEPPVARAALVATGALLASRVGRRADLVTLVLLAGAAYVAARPDRLWSLSFQLSLAASLALAAVVPSLTPLGPLGWLRTALTATVAAQVATLPILLPRFGETSLIAVPANLLVGPLVNVAFPLAAAGAVLGIAWAPLAQLVLFPAALLAEAILGIIDALASVAVAGSVGVVPLPGAIAVWGAAALAVVGLSAEGRAWAARIPQEVRGASAAARVAWLAAVAGILLLALLAAR